MMNGKSLRLDLQLSTNISSPTVQENATKLFNKGLISYIGFNEVFNWIYSGFSAKVRDI